MKPVTEPGQRDYVCEVCSKKLLEGVWNCGDCANDLCSSCYDEIKAKLWFNKYGISFIIFQKVFRPRGPNPGLAPAEYVLMVNFLGEEKIPKLINFRFMAAGSMVIYSVYFFAILQQ